jgi:FKBP-type peptidyl-prolyl cis-trans isomerase SlyD
MKIGRDSVVSITYTLFDAQGELVEQALQGKEQGDTASVKLEPADAFGDYDEELLRVESRDQFPEVLEVGMQFEGIPGDGDGDGDDEDAEIFTVTDIAEGKVVLDANHPLAGMALVFECRVLEVRAATREEIAHRHVHGPGGHHH